LIVVFLSHNNIGDPPELLGSGVKDSEDPVDVTILGEVVQDLELGRAEGEASDKDLEALKPRELRSSIFGLERWPDGDHLVLDFGVLERERRGVGTFVLEDDETEAFDVLGALAQRDVQG